MNDKSYVSLERHICLVCLSEYDTGAILLDRRLRASMSKYTTTDWGLCPPHEELFSNGFVALVECDPEKSGNPPVGGTVKPEEAYRTGRVAHVKREAFAQVFNVPISQDLPCVFVEPAVIEELQSMAQPSASPADNV